MSISLPHASFPGLLFPLLLLCINVGGRKERRHAKERMLLVILLPPKYQRGRGRPGNEAIMYLGEFDDCLMACFINWTRQRN